MVHPKEEGSDAGLSEYGDVEAFKKTFGALLLIDSLQCIVDAIVFGYKIFCLFFAIVT